MEIIIPLELKQVLEQKGYAPDRDGVLMFWQDTKVLLEQMKSLEMEIRKIAVKLTITQPKEGMNTVELGNGYVAKAQIKYNYKLSDNDTVDTCLERIRKIGNEGSFIADRLVSWTPNFLLTEYRNLQEQAKKGDRTAQEILKIVPEFLTISEASPTLEIKPPK
jgi:hypothetical protein